jgi:mediator of RNA polymerase II transcription subunit 12
MYLIDGRLVCRSLVPDLITYGLLAELAVDNKANPTDFFRNYPQIHLAKLPADMPAEYRQQLRCLLPYPPPNECAADLVYASLDSSGQTLPGLPVTNQPWDWVESLGDNAPGETPTEGGIRNNASLSLELFSARATGNSVRPEKNARGFHDTLGGESVFARDWAETRISLTDETSARREDEDAGGVQHAMAAARRGMSPASPAWSRQSATSSRLQSPTQQSFTRGSASRSDEPPDMERSSVGSRQMGKRKASTVGSESDMEVIDSPRALKKAKAKAKPPPVKPRGKRK